MARLFPGLNQEKFRVFARMLGGLSGKTVNQAEVARALGVSPPTVRDYFEIAQGSFLWRQLPAFIRNVTKRVVKHPKGYLRDSGLGHHALRIPDVTSLLAHPQAGASWEGMVVEEICRQLEQRGIDYDAYHYRVSGGAEVDLVLEGAFGLAAVEIKLGQRVRLQSLREFLFGFCNHETWRRVQYGYRSGSQIPQERNPAPHFGRVMAAVPGGV